MFRICLTPLALALLLPGALLAQSAARPEGLASGATPAESTRPLEGNTRWIQGLVDEMRTRLAIPQAVQVSVVPSNSRIVSVEPLEGGTFSLLLDGAFLASLSEDEVQAALAHELGHVWVFTHHPYLQTERLANEIALRLVTRDSLVRVYEKMWERQGTKGDLVRFVGD